jgi:hypothetical protein
MKLKDKFKNWLFQEEAKKFDDAIKIAQDYYNRSDGRLSRAIDMCNDNSKILDEAQRLINKFIDLGMDVGFHSEDHSWAVLCVKGKPEYVKFVPLTHKNVMELAEFLKRFKYSDRQVDSPFGFRDLIEDLIFKM